MSRILLRHVVVLLFLLTKLCRGLSFLSLIKVGSPDHSIVFSRKHGSCRSIRLFQATQDDDNAKSHYSYYAGYWRTLLLAEQREAADELRVRRSNWSRKRLEESGVSVFDACAEPESDLFGEKIVRIYCKPGETTTTSSSFSDRFARGDVLVLTTTTAAIGRRRAFMGSTSRRRQTPLVPRECCIVDIGKDWMTVAVGPTWPAGLWEARRLPGSYMVRLDRTSPQAPVKAQLSALELARKGKAGEAAKLLVESFCFDQSSAISKGSDPLCWFDSSDERIVWKALDVAKSYASLRPNRSQEDAIVWALGRRLSLVVGPPGTGKTRVAALLISTALRLLGTDWKSSPRILAVAHSNGAADVLLEALLRIGIPAVRLGRPASVSPNVRHRTVIAMADTHPEVVSHRQRSRSSSMAETRHCIKEVCNMILQTAPVVVASCVGAHQLLEDGSEVIFPLVVVDEAAQTTEPGLLCALAAAKAEQVVLLGDTQQLPPTVASQVPQIRENLGASPMARLEASGVEQRTLKIQYRMAPALLHHPSMYFYAGLVVSANGLVAKRPPPLGFSWPAPNDPLAFIQSGGNLEVAHEFGGRSNPVEAVLVANIVLGLLKAGDLEPHGVAVISPYSKQVQCLRIELSARSIRDVQVGTVDSFQGQESDMVLFSAVRSNRDNELGFLRDPRRLCVALTRAKRGLVIVGDQAVLRTSRHWAALIDSCQERGCFLNAKDLDVDQATKRTPQTKAVEPLRTSKRKPMGVSWSDEESLLDQTDEFLGLFDNSEM